MEIMEQDLYAMNDRAELSLTYEIFDLKLEEKKNFRWKKLRAFDFFLLLSVVLRLSKKKR